MAPTCEYSIILNLHKEPCTYDSQLFRCSVDGVEAVVLPSVSSLAESVVRLLHAHETRRGAEQFGVHLEQQRVFLNLGD